MEFDILYAIQSIHTPFWDNFMLILTKVVGNYAQLWLVAAVILLFFKKTRKCGVCIIISYLLVLLVGQFAIKNLVARPRPYQIDESVPLLVDKLRSYSCPSTHSAWSFAAATSIFMHYKKIGIAALLFAALIAFSRLYLFVHFPTDVLIGMALGIASAVATCLVARKYPRKRKI